MHFRFLLYSLGMDLKLFNNSAVALIMYVYTFCFLGWGVGRAESRFSSNSKKKKKFIESNFIEFKHLWLVRTRVESELFANNLTEFEFIESNSEFLNFFFRSFFNFLIF